MSALKASVRFAKGDGYTTTSAFRVPGTTDSGTRIRRDKSPPGLSRPLASDFAQNPRPNTFTTVRTSSTWGPALKRSTTSWLPGLRPSLPRCMRTRCRPGGRISPAPLVPKILKPPAMLKLLREWFAGVVHQTDGGFDRIAGREEHGEIRLDGHRASQLMSASALPMPPSSAKASAMARKLVSRSEQWKLMLALPWASVRRAGFQ